MNVDSLQVAVTFANAQQTINASDVSIYVTFARRRGTRGIRRTASPFGQGPFRWVQTIFGIGQAVQPDPVQNSFYLPLGIPTVVLESGTYPFEFSVVVTLNVNGNSVQFGYDPELDVTVDSVPIPLTPGSTTPAP